MKKQLAAFVVCNILLFYTTQIWAFFGVDSDAPKKTGLWHRIKTKKKHKEWGTPAERQVLIPHHNSVTRNSSSQPKTPLTLLGSPQQAHIQKSFAHSTKRYIDIDEEKEDGYSIESLSVADALKKQEDERYAPISDTPMCTFNPELGFKAPDGHKDGLQFISFIAHISPALAKHKQLPNAACTLSVYRTQGHKQTRFLYPYDTCDANCLACGYHERFDIIPLVEHFFCCQQSVGKTIQQVPDISKLSNHNVGRSGKGIVTICSFYFCQQKNLGKELWVPAVYNRQRYEAKQLIVLTKTLQEDEQQKEAYLMQYHVDVKCSPKK